MNNPIRAAMQRHIEAPIFLRMGGPLRDARVLEIGCGRGVGAEVIFDVFGAAAVDAFDLDPRMVERAQRRLSSRGPRVRLWVGDAAAIAAPEAVYDAVFDFGIIHHVPDWRAVLAEVYRVLRPGACFMRRNRWRGYSTTHCCTVCSRTRWRTGLIFPNFAVHSVLRASSLHERSISGTRCSGSSRPNQRSAEELLPPTAASPFRPAPQDLSRSGYQFANWLAQIARSDLARSAVPVIRSNSRPLLRDGPRRVRSWRSGAAPHQRDDPLQ